MAVRFFLWNVAVLLMTPLPLPVVERLTTVVVHEVVGLFGGAEGLTLWRESMMQGICAMGKFMGNGHLSRHCCCLRWYHLYEYT